LIRKTIQDAYLTGTDIVTDKITDKNEDFTPFISRTDINNIDSLTNKMSEQFWTTTSKLVRREQESVLNDETKELEKKKSFDSEAAIIGLSALFAYQSYNTAVTSKMQQTIPILSAQPIQSNNLLLDIQFGIEQLDSFNLPLEGKVMFLTQEDAKVDEEICAPLNRTVWDVNDPELVVPPEDTHRFCRCRLIPVIDEATV